MATRVTPLNIHMRITNDEGKPTPEFLRWWQEQLRLVNPLATDDGVSSLIDLLGQTRGSLLIRGASGWTILTPGTSGYALVSQGAGADPVYAALVDSFLDLSDTPGAYTGQALKGVRVNAGATGLEFYTISGGGTQGLGYAGWDAPGNIFTAQNSGSPDDNSYDSSDDSWNIETTGDQGFAWAYTSINGAADFDVVFVFRGHFKADDFAQMGVFYADGNLTSAHSYYIDGTMLKQLWTRPSTFGSSAGTVSNLLYGSRPYGSAHWYMRITLVGSTTSVYVSMNGLDWDLVFTGTDTENGMTEIDTIGFWMASNGVTAGVNNQIRCIGYNEDGPQAEILV